MKKDVLSCILEAVEKCSCEVKDYDRKSCKERQMIDLSIDEMYKSANSLDELSYKSSVSDECYNKLYDMQSADECFIKLVFNESNETLRCLKQRIYDYLYMHCPKNENEYHSMFNDLLEYLVVEFGHLYKECETI